MGRLWILSFVLLLSRVAIAQGDAGGGSPLDQARQLMKEGLEREVPAPAAPAAHRQPEWPRPEGAQKAPAAPADSVDRRVEALSERARNDANLRVRALAEERRTLPDNQPGISQSRTRAAKTAGPPPIRPRPPRP